MYRNCLRTLSLPTLVRPQANKLLPELRKAAAPDIAASPDASVTSSSSTPDANGAAAAAVDEDELALCIGHFLRVAPGLNKTTIGELLGEPDQFYLKVELTAVVADARHICSTLLTACHYATKSCACLQQFCVPCMSTSTAPRWCCDAMVSCKHAYAFCFVL